MGTERRSGEAGRLRRRLAARSGTGRTSISQPSEPDGNPGLAGGGQTAELAWTPCRWVGNELGTVGGHRESRT